MWTEHLVARTFVSVLASPHMMTYFYTHIRAHGWLKGQLGSSLPRAFSKRHLHPHALSLLGVPQTSASFCSTPPPLLTPNSLLMTGIRTPQSATPRLGGQSGHLADTTQITGNEPKTCIEVSSVHTPINFPTRRDSFNLENNLKIAVSEDSDHFPQRSTAGTVPALLNTGS